MTGTSPGGRTARARFARCVALIAVLVGLVLLPCADGMMMTGGGDPAHGATAAMALDAAVDGGAAIAAADTGMPGSRDQSGLLATCLVFLIVAAVWALRPARSRAVVAVLTRARSARRRAFGARALSLSQLCLLRT